MAEYIDRNAFIQRYRALYCMDCISRKGYKNGKLVTLYKIGEAPCRSCREDDVLCALENYPVADVVEVRRGKPLPSYEPFEDYDGAHIHRVQTGWECPFCGCDGARNFCPNCGAKMDEEGNNA